MHIDIRILGTLLNVGVGGKVVDTIELMIGKNFIECFFVGNIDVIEFEVGIIKVLFNKRGFTQTKVVDYCDAPSRSIIQLRVISMRRVKCIVALIVSIFRGECEWLIFKLILCS